SGCNNDGRGEGPMTPRPDGQRDAMARAYADAKVPVESIGYVETHGTATELGDPVELAALTKAFRLSTDKSGFCALGAVKANVGHLDSAAGIAGLIKTALALHHETVPPLANFEAPNPELQLAATPFTIPTEARPWGRNGRPRVAGVSSFGIGGTNVHAVLEEAPAAPEPSAPARHFLVLALGARTEEALDALGRETADALAAASPLEAADLVYTLNTRRLRWPVTRAVVGADGAALARTLRGPDRPRVAARGPAEIAFVYAGMGSNPAGLGASLYATEPAFRRHVDACQAGLARAGFDVRRALVEAPVGQRLPVGLAGSALFTFETALERLLASWGVRPAFVLGHSFGEYAAALSAGVLSLDAALGVVAARCDAMAAMAEGAMLVATCSAEAAADFARRADVEIAALNGPNATVFSGPLANVERLQKE
ncbi:MAG TPA: acyltransferase domain-containing protein, partial [Polyangiaceae bacterium]|nr:acyltransferase domain-containing protein [Polyangiaceae bacterium]